MWDWVLLLVFPMALLQEGILLILGSIGTIADWVFRSEVKQKFRHVTLK
jgi:hypothetical protein